jgi:hypothetical protein
MQIVESQGRLEKTIIWVPTQVSSFLTQIKYIFPEPTTLALIDFEDRISLLLHITNAKSNVYTFN